MLRNLYGLDIGGENTRLYSGEIGEVYEEPTLLLFNEFGELKAFGREARQLLGKNPPYYHFQRPVTESGIQHFEDTYLFLEQFLKRYHVMKGIFKPLVCLNTPLGSTPVQVQASIELLESLGFSQVYTLPTPVGSALGSGLDIQDSSGNLVIHLGATHIEIAVISLFKIVSGKHIPTGLNDFYRKIALFLREEYSLETSERMAEEWARESMDLSNGNSEQEFFAVGIDLNTHLPKKVKLKNSVFLEIGKDFFEKFTQSIQEVFETVGPEIVKDILERGIIFTGGGATVKGLSEFFEKRTMIRLLIPQNPAHCTVLGNWQYLNALVKKELPYGSALLRHGSAFLLPNLY